MADPELPPNVTAALRALRTDPRVLQESLDGKVEEIESHIRSGKVHGGERAADLGAELRLAAHLLQRVAAIKSMVFPTDDPPDLALRYRDAEVTVEVIRLAVRAPGPTSDEALANAETFSAQLLGTCSEGRPDWHVWTQVRRKTRRTGRPANVLVIVSDSPTVKPTLIGAIGTWRAVTAAAVDGESVPFGDCVVWYDGPLLNETPCQIGANRAHQTPASRALIVDAFAGIGPYLVPGPGDDDWDRERARRELYHIWEIEDRGRRS